MHQRAVCSFCTQHNNKRETKFIKQEGMRPKETHMMVTYVWATPDLCVGNSLRDRIFNQTSVMSK